MKDVALRRAFFDLIGVEEATHRDLIIFLGFAHLRLGTKYRPVIRKQERQMVADLLGLSLHTITDSFYRLIKAGAFTKNTISDYSINYKMVHFVNSQQPGEEDV